MFYKNIILNKCLKPLNPNADELSMVNTINYKFAQMVTFKKIKLKETQNSKAKLVNYYGINFISSGFGKDKIINELNDYVFEEFDNYFKLKKKENYELELGKITYQSTLEYPDSLKEQKKYVGTEKSKIRQLKFELQHATPEGLYEDALTVSALNYGNICVRIPEFGDYISNLNPSKQDLLSLLKGAYDGEILPKSTKYESFKEKVSGVPINCLLYTDSVPLDTGKAKSYTENLLSSGIARRAFTAFSEMKIQTSIIVEDRIKVIDSAISDGKKIGKKLFETYRKLEIGTQYILSKEAYKIYEDYKRKNIIEYNSLLGKEDEQILKEINGKDWKMLKLATILAAIEHPTVHEVLEDDINEAIKETELFSKSFLYFVKRGNKSDVDKYLQKFIDNENEWLTKGNIREFKILSQNYFSKQFDELFPYIAEKAENSGYLLQKELINNNTGMRCKLIKKNDNILNLNQLGISSDSS